MALAVVMSIVAGVFGVLQAGMNKGIADHVGFTSSLLMNGLFFLGFNTLFFVFMLWQPKALPSEFSVQWTMSAFRWWWVVPGLLGFALVMGLAVSVGRIGSVQTFVICIAAQIVTSVVYDIVQGEASVSTMRLVGAGVTMVGAILATIS